jgi:hypothetical protein
VDAPQANNIWTPHRILAACGVVSVAVSGLLTNLDALDNPWARWIAWAATASLFTLAWYQSKDERAEFLRDGSTAKTRAIYALGALVFLAVLITDVLLVVLRDPIKHSGMNSFNGLQRGYTTSAADNPLVLEKVKNVGPTIEDLEDVDNPFQGIFSEIQFQKQKGIDQLLIQDCKVIVERYLNMPPYLTYAYGVGEVDAIEAAFMLSKMPSQLPWEFSATHIALNGRRDTSFPLHIEDFTPAKLRYYISARDPGIYWVKCIVVVSDGVGPPKSVELTDKAIPLAFFDDKTMESGITELQALQDKQWAPFPVVSPNERSKRAQDIKKWQSDAAPAPAEGDIPPAPVRDDIPPEPVEAAPAAPEAPPA